MPVQLEVDPEAVLAAHRLADSPMNVITPLNAYFALVVVFAQKHDKGAGAGTIVALMIPSVVGLFIVWTLMCRLGQAYLACAEETAKVEIWLRSIAAAIGGRKSGSAGWNSRAATG